MERPNPAYRIPVSYIDKSRDYYAAHDYPKPYRWAHNDDGPFQPLLQPVSDCRVAIVTTTTPPHAAETVDADPVVVARKTTYAEPVDPVPSAMYTLDLSWDKEETHTRDVESFLPLQTIQSFAAEGRIGSLSDRFYGVPTEYSQRRTNDVDAPAILRLCREDNVDAMILVPLWPVCHQSVSLTARHLETNGIPTVIVGSARDIVEQCGVPRFLFQDFPLGNPCGVPYDESMQHATLGMALDLLETAMVPRTTVQTPFVWPSGSQWRRNYMRVDESNIEELRRAGQKRREQQASRKSRAGRR